MTWLLRWKLIVAAVVGVVVVGGSVPLFMAVMLAPAHAATTAGTTAGSGLKPGSVPPQYEPIVLAAGKLCPALTPATLAVQYGTESSWNERAVSPVGAEGLAQFMPDTWKEYGIDADEDGVADPFSPVDALWSGAVYDCALAKETDGTTRTMLAAYNAGPGNVGAGLGYADHIIAEAKQIEVELPKTDLAGLPKPGPGGCSLPLAGYTKTGTFGEGRPGHTHAGEDLAAPEGTPIVSPCAGVVVYAGEAQGYGNYTCVQHAVGLVTCNGHQSAILVQVNQRVGAGQVIGRVGSTGHSTGPHDHFEVRAGLWGTPQNPTAWYASLGLRL